MGLPASISGRASRIKSTITGRRARSSNCGLLITCCTASALALCPSSAAICSSLNLASSRTSNWGGSPVRFFVDAFSSALSSLRPSIASGKCSVRQVKIALAPGATTVASSQKLSIMAWRFTRAAISSNPSKISNSLPIRFSCSKALYPGSGISCFSKKNSENSDLTLTALA